MMINMFDKDKSGTINIHEFGALFSYINQWKGMFEAIDKDRSGFIEEGEFSQALTQMGYRFSPTFVQVTPCWSCSWIFTPWFAESAVKV